LNFPKVLIHSPVNPLFPSAMGTSTFGEVSRYLWSSSGD
jgi:hypothetical protein